MKIKTGNKNHSSFSLAKIKPLKVSFYTNKNVVAVAKALIGKIIITNFDNMLTAARIVETEAYNGITDKASHAYNTKRTARTEIMYSKGGVAYVYLCYGIHHLFNVVSSIENEPHAVLIRAAEPLAGVDIMLMRTNKKTLNNTLTKGPGNVSKALGIFTKHSGIDLLQKEIFIATDNKKIPEKDIGISPRIGVDYAAEDALLPYRFYIKNNPYVSGKINK